MLGRRAVVDRGAWSLALCFAGVRDDDRDGRPRQPRRARRRGPARAPARSARRARARADRASREVAQLAIDVIELGLGVRVDVLLAAAEDCGWTDASRRRGSPTRRAPDPLLGAWLAEQRGAAVRRRHASVARRSARARCATLFAHNERARSCRCAAHDELLALVLVPTREAGARRAASRSSSARRSGSPRRSSTRGWRSAPPQRAALAREVELAATVQAAAVARQRPARPRRRHASSARGCPRRGAPATSGACYPLGDQRACSSRSATSPATASRRRRSPRPRSAACDVMRAPRTARRSISRSSSPRSMRRCAASAAAQLVDDVLRRDPRSRGARDSLRVLRSYQLPTCAASATRRSSCTRWSAAEILWAADRHRLRRSSRNRCEPAISSSGIRMV